jgi:hypothetical protein
MKNSVVKKILIAACLLMGCCSSNAQNCTDALIDTMLGVWKPLQKGAIPYSITKTDVAKERVIMEGVNETIRKNITNMPVGGNIGYGAFWEGDDHRPTQIIQVSDSYYNYITYEQFHCYEGKVNGDGLYGDGSSFHTFFNELPFTFGNSFYTPGPNATDQGIDPLTDVYAFLRSLPEVKDGYFDYIVDEGDGTGNTTGNISRYRTITKPGKLPYIVMSKKEYYEKWKKKHLIEIENNKSEKARFNKEMAGSDQLPGMLKMMDQYITMTQDWVTTIDNLLKNKSAEALAQPAYQGEENGAWFESRQADGYMRSYIVEPNFSYYNFTLHNKPAPQVITLRFQYYQDSDAMGNKRYNCIKFYKALEKMNIFELLTEKLKPLIVVQ